MIYKKYTGYFMNIFYLKGKEKYKNRIRAPVSKTKGTLCRTSVQIEECVI